MRRKEREVTDSEEIRKVLGECKVCRLGMIADGKPYIVPMNMGCDYDGEKLIIYFHCAKEGKKIDCLRYSPAVCISCVGDTQRLKDEFTTKYESAIVTGIATQVTERDEKILALKAICERHTPANMQNFDEAINKSLFRTDIWKVSIDSITGKSKR